MWPSIHQAQDQASRCLAQPADHLVLSAVPVRRAPEVFGSSQLAEIFNTYSSSGPGRDVNGS